MFNKKELLVSNSPERINSVLDLLLKNNIDYKLNFPMTSDNGINNIPYAIFVQKRDYEKALYFLHTQENI